MNSRSLFFFVVCCLLIAVHTLNAAESYLDNSAMYADTTFAEEQYQFTPYDKLYLVLDLINLSPGQHNLAVDWITPFGSLERQTTHTITTVGAVSSQRVYFWFKFIKRGPLKRTLTGKDFKDEFYGEWKVNYYLDGLLLGWKAFEVR